MITKQINFESERLYVDYISFDIEGLRDVQAIANYFFENFGFNSIITKDSSQKPEFLIYNEKNEFRVFFRQYDSNPEFKSKRSTKIDFSEENAAQIYKIIQTQNFDWNIFPEVYAVIYLEACAVIYQSYKISLNRFDLCYFREKKSTEQEADLKLFMKKCYQKAFRRSKKKYC